MSDKRDESEREARKSSMAKAVQTMMDEHPYDAIVIMGSWQTEDGSTAAISESCGNYYARLGMMEYQVERIRETARDEQRQIEESERDT